MSAIIFWVHLLLLPATLPGHHGIVPVRAVGPEIPPASISRR